MDQVLISVIVPARNAAASLPACLDALQSQTLGPDRLEIIVVDDGSTDTTAALASRPGMRCVSIPPSGPAAARNHGAGLARGDLLFFTDADCVPAPDWAARLAAALADPAVAGARGTYRTRERGLMPRFVQVEYASKYARTAGLAAIDFVDTYSAAYRRTVFVENGGFDVSFPTASVEDQEFSFRLARKGCRMVFAPEAVVYHRHDLTVGEYARRKFGIGYWKAYLLGRHPDKAWGDSHTPPGQRLQILWLGLAGIALLLAWTGPLALGAAALCLLAFAVTTVPFLVFVAREDTPVLAVAPLLLIVRAGALGLGLGIGMLAQLGRLARRRQKEAA